MTKLSVNINKIATLRNARNENYPNLLKTAQDILSFGAQGITVHPRPDERHVRYSDVYELKKNINSELNIEGNPIKKFIDLVNDVKPDQVTLVPDSEYAITSNSGWDTITNFSYLNDIIKEFKSNSIRVSIFIDPNINMVEGAKKLNADRIELFTGPFAKEFDLNRSEAVKDYVKCSKIANEINIDINAGHDLNQHNLLFFSKSVKNIKEVSIGHALITESLYLGLETTIKTYLDILKWKFFIQI